MQTGNFKRQQIVAGRNARTTLHDDLFGRHTGKQGKKFTA